MKRRPSKSLRNELQAAGARGTEVNELMAVVGNLKRLKNPRRSVARPLIASFAGLAVGMAVVILSLTVLPGSLLYPVQKLSDNVAMSINPGYRGTVMMKRAQQVKQLITSHADPQLVLATLADYRAEASAYKSAPSNYAVFEYCKNNLQQAAAAAPNPERQAINAALLSLKDV